MKSQRMPLLRLLALCKLDFQRGAAFLKRIVFAGNDWGIRQRHYPSSCRAVSHLPGCNRCTSAVAGKILQSEQLELTLLEKVQYFRTTQELNDERGV